MDNVFPIAQHRLMAPLKLHLCLCGDFALIRTASLTVSCVSSQRMMNRMYANIGRVESGNISAKKPMIYAKPQVGTKVTKKATAAVSFRLVNSIRNQYTRGAGWNKLL